MWKLNIKNVNNEYDKYVDPGDDDGSYGIWWWSDAIGLLFNFRKINDLGDGMVLNLRGESTQIPKHYWTIKELY